MKNKSNQSNNNCITSISTNGSSSSSSTATYGYVTSVNSNLGTLTTSNVVSGWATSSDYGYRREGADEQDSFEYIIKYLTNEEIEDLCEKLKFRNLTESDNKKYETLIKYIVKNRICSEKFILGNIDYLEVNDILKLHTPLLHSEGYEALKLYISSNGK